MDIIEFKMVLTSSHIICRPIDDKDRASNMRVGENLVGDIFVDPYRHGVYFTKKYWLELGHE